MRRRQHEQESHGTLAEYYRTEKGVSLANALKCIQCEGRRQKMWMREVEE